MDEQQLNWDLDLQRILEQGRDQGRYPSAVSLIFDRERLLACAHVGEVDGRTLFDVASLTKIATATQIFLLIEQGAAELHSKLGALLPELAERPELARRVGGVTLFELLTHTSGLPAWYPFYTAEGGFYEVLPLALDFCGPAPAPTYSDLNFMLLGRVAERLSGLPLEQSLRQLVAQPLGLDTLGYRPAPARNIAPCCLGNQIEEAMCRERGLCFGGWRPHGVPVMGQVNDGNAWYFGKGVSGHAGVFSSAEDYMELCRFHLTRETPVFVRAPQRVAGDRALAWQVGELYPDGCGHTGFTGTCVFISRGRGVGAVTFTNRLFQDPPGDGLNGMRLAVHTLALNKYGRQSPIIYRL